MNSLSYCPVIEPSISLNAEISLDLKWFPSDKVRLGIGRCRCAAISASAIVKKFGVPAPANAAVCWYYCTY